MRRTRALETARSSISGSTIPADTDTDFDAGVTQSDESEDYEAESIGRGKSIMHSLIWRRLSSSLYRRSEACFTKQATDTCRGLVWYKYAKEKETD